MSIIAADLARILEQWAPLRLTASWDRGGFQAGDPNKGVKKVLVALDVDSHTVAAAVEQKAQMIIAHHPMIFKPLDDLRLDRPRGALAAKVIQSGLIIYCAHTNLDQAPGGTDDLLVELLDLQNVRILKPTRVEEIYKLVVFVPEGYENAVRVAVSEAGAGWIGNYSHCTFQVPGTGTFKPLAESNPFIGSPGKIEHVRECRLETIVPRRFLPRVLEAMHKSHPYEEVAYDLYRTERNEMELGFGRVGQLAVPLPLSELAQQVKNTLQLDYVQVVGEPGKEINSLALCGGSGGSFLPEVIEQNADAFLTGDVKYHDAVLASEAAIGIIDAGHMGTEKQLVPAISEYIRRELALKKIEVDVVSHYPRELFRVV